MAMTLKVHFSVGNLRRLQWVLSMMNSSWNKSGNDCAYIYIQAKALRKLLHIFQAFFRWKKVLSMYYVVIIRVASQISNETKREKYGLTSKQDYYYLTRQPRSPAAQRLWPRPLPNASPSPRPKPQASCFLDVMATKKEQAFCASTIMLPRKEIVR